MILEGSSLARHVITLTPRVPLATVVVRPPMARSGESAPKFQVPFLALEARLTPPVYITSDDASDQGLTRRGAFRLRSTFHPSGRVSVGVPSCHIESKFSLTAGCDAVSPMAAEATGAEKIPDAAVAIAMIRVFA